MNEQTSTLGSKIRYFRKRAKLSQFQLENEIGASAGSISRIENNEVNPTKETISLIGTTLNLKPTELSYILGNHYSPTTLEDRQNAIKSANSLMDLEYNYSYLLDEQSRIISISKGFINLAIQNNFDINKILNRHTIDVMFDRENGLRDLMNDLSFKDTARGVLGVIKQERDYLQNEVWMIELIGKLKLNQEFISIWNELDKSPVDLHLPQNRYVEFITKDGLAKMQFVFTPLDLDHRFQILEYLSVD